MAAMVTQGPEAARDVCSHFDLNKKTLYTLATKRDSKVRNSRRLVPPVCFLSLWRAVVVVSCPFSDRGPHMGGVEGLYVEKQVAEPG